MSKIVSSEICKNKKCPDASMINKNMDRIDYSDSYSVKIASDYPVDVITDKILALPGWVKFLLKVRYYLIAIPFGLNSGKKEVPVLYKNDNEIVLGENDKHLYYRISIFKGNGNYPVIHLTTNVKFNNLLGKVYFIFIKPFHKLVVKSLLKKITNIDRQDSSSPARY